MQNLSKAKVSELDIEVLVQEDIFGFDVSVNHPSPVTVLQRFCHLLCINIGNCYTEIYCWGDKLDVTCRIILLARFSLIVTTLLR